jgi:hypothetical protein
MYVSHVPSGTYNQLTILCFMNTTAGDLDLVATAVLSIFEPTTTLLTPYERR